MPNFRRVVIIGFFVVYARSVTNAVSGEAVSRDMRRRALVLRRSEDVENPSVLRQCSEHLDQRDGHSLFFLKLLDLLLDAFDRCRERLERLHALLDVA